jgi:hypothetical protein
MSHDEHPVMAVERHDLTVIREPAAEDDQDRNR